MHFYKYFFYLNHVGTIPWTQIDTFFLYSTISVNTYKQNIQRLISTINKIYANQINRTPISFLRKPVKYRLKFHLKLLSCIHPLNLFQSCYIIILSEPIANHSIIFETILVEYDLVLQKNKILALFFSNKKKIFRWYHLVVIYALFNTNSYRLWQTQLLQSRTVIS